MLPNWDKLSHQLLLISITRSVDVVLVGIVIQRYEAYGSCDWFSKQVNWAAVITTG